MSTTTSWQPVIIEESPRRRLRERLDLFVEVVLFDEGKDVAHPAAVNGEDRVLGVRLQVTAGRRELPVRALEVVQPQSDLLQVVGALRPGRGFADLLDGGKQKPDEDRDDGNHDQ